MNKFITYFLALTLINNFAFAAGNEKSDDDFSPIKKKISLTNISKSIDSITFLPESSIGTKVNGFIYADDSKQATMTYYLKTRLMDVKFNDKISAYVLPFEVSLYVDLANGNPTLEYLRAGLGRVVFSPAGVSGQILSYVQSTFSDGATFKGAEFLSLKYDKSVEIKTKTKVEFVFSGEVTFGKGKFYGPTGTSTEFDSWTTTAKGSVGINIAQKVYLEFFGGTNMYYSGANSSEFYMNESFGINAKYMINDWLALIAGVGSEFVGSKMLDVNGYIGLEITF